MGHPIFLNAALNLLNEKDSTAVEMGMRDPRIPKESIQSRELLMESQILWSSLRDGFLLRKERCIYCELSTRGASPTQEHPVGGLHLNM